MNPKIALVAAALAVVLVILAVVLFASVPGHGERLALERELFDYSIPKIDRVTGKREKEVVYELERQGDRWVYKTPALGDADAGKVLRALSDLRFDAKVKNTVEVPGGGAALAPFGLAKPKIEVSLHEVGRTIAFEIGSRNATQDSVYVRILAGGRVVLTDPAPVSLFDVAPEAFRK